MAAIFRRFDMERLARQFFVIPPRLKQCAMERNWGRVSHDLVEISGEVIASRELQLARCVWVDVTGQSGDPLIKSLFERVAATGDFIEGQNLIIVANESCWMRCAVAFERSGEK
jgi:hypothetical protein